MPIHNGLNWRCPLLQIYQNPLVSASPHRTLDLIGIPVSLYLAYMHWGISCFKDGQLQRLSQGFTTLRFASLPVTLN
jgi:hypothetical protein